MLIVLLIKFPQKAKQLRDLRAEDARNQTDTSKVFPEVAKAKEKTDELEKLFINESGVVDFVKDVESLRGENSAVSALTFQSQKYIKDRTNNFGVPLTIVMKGNWQQIASDLEKIQKFPYLYRAVNIEVKPDKDAEGVVEFRYGIFLYVNDKLGQN